MCPINSKRWSTKFIKAAASVALLGGLVGHVAAAPIVYSDESLFLSDAATLQMESFEGFAATGTFATDSIDNGDVDISVSGHNLGILDSAYNGSFATDGDHYVRYQSDAGESLSFTFTHAINSFGVNITDWGDFGIGSLLFENSNGDYLEVAVTPFANGASLFFGVIDSSLFFNQVTFVNTIAGEAYGIDEVYYGKTVAEDVIEPAGVGLMAMGLFGLWGGRRYRFLNAGQA